MDLRPMIVRRGIHTEKIISLKSEQLCAITLKNTVRTSKGGIHRLRVVPVMFNVAWLIDDQRMILDGKSLMETQYLTE